MPGSPGFDASFSVGLGNQLPALTQTYWVGIELGLFTNPINGSCECEHGISCLTQAQSFS